MTEDVQAPGRESIRSAFRAVYGTADPDHRAPPPAHRPPAAGGVLDGISAYRGDDHWHLVTFGLTDLVAKTPGQSPGRSRFGHELTLTVPASGRAPGWAYDLLLGIARVCVTVRRPFHAGARLAPGEPVDGASSALVAVGIREDPLVSPSAFPFGRFVFLQAVGVTDVEFRLMQRAGTLTVLQRLAARDRLLRTDPQRR